MTYPPSGQSWSGQPEQNQPQYGGYSGGAPTPPLSGPPYSQGAYETGGYNPQESYTTEPPMSGQPYQQPSYDQGYSYGPRQQPPAYQGYAPPQQAPSFVTPPPPSRNRGGMLALVIGGIVILLILVGVGVGLAVTSGDDDPVATPTPAASSASPSPTEAADYPARIDLPTTVAGLTKVTDNAALNQTANETAQQLKADTDADSAIAAYYAPAGDLTKVVGLVGVTGRITDPEGELEEAFTGELDVTGIQDVDAGPLGGTMRCGTTADNGQALTVCGWADGGSLAVGIFLNRSQTESATLFRQIRGEILKRG